MKFTAEAVARKNYGKGAARQIRRTGKIPAVVYGQGKSQLLELDPGAIRKILTAQAGSTGLISLKVTDGKEENQTTTVIQDYQVDPIVGSLLHVDLFEVDMSKSVRVKVHVQITGGTPVGVKIDKGVLHILRQCFYFRGSRIFDWFGLLKKYGISHFSYSKYGHVLIISSMFAVCGWLLGLLLINKICYCEVPRWNVGL